MPLRPFKFWFLLFSWLIGRLRSCVYWRFYVANYLFKSKNFLCCLYFSSHMKSLSINGKGLAVANSYHFHVGGIAWRLSRLIALKDMHIDRFYASIFLKTQKRWRDSNLMLALLEECPNWDLERICIYKDLK